MQWQIDYRSEGLKELRARAPRTSPSTFTRAPSNARARVDRSRTPTKRMSLANRITVCALVAATTTALAPNAGRSRLFLDSASMADWDDLLPTGLFYGITTNPSILERDGVRCDIKSVSRLASDALDAGVQSVMIQAWGGTADAYERCALGVLDRTGAADNVVIKLPLTREGIVAARRLKEEAHLCLTAAYAKEQAIVAAALKCDYLAPYAGRMSDAGLDGLAECRKMQEALVACRSPTRVLVASLRKASMVFDVYAAGSDATISPEVARALLSFERTDKAAAEFELAVGCGEDEACLAESLSMDGATKD